MPDSIDLFCGGRLRLVYVSFELWLDSLLTNHRVKCLNLPHEAKVVRGFPCTERHGRDVVLWLTSPDFEPVAEGELIPEFRLIFEAHREDQKALDV
jgi:hypothetical protein